MPRVEIDVERCKGCELCIKACPKDCLALADKYNSAGYYPSSLAHPDNCIGCSFCALVCPDLAIEVFKEE